MTSAAIVSVAGKRRSALGALHLVSKCRSGEGTKSLRVTTSKIVRSSFDDADKDEGRAATLARLETPNATMIREHAPGAPALIVFSSLNSNGFSFFKICEALPVTKIYVRDPFDLWFQHGISDAVANPDALVDHLRGILDVLKPKRLVTVGSSMGGYAALLFGARLRAAAIVACSPQTIIDPRLPHTPSRSFVASETFDLQALLRPQNRHRPAMHIFYGSDDIVDIWNVSRLKQQKQDVRYPIAGQDHLAATLLTANGDLAAALVGLCGAQPFTVRAEIDRRCEDRRVVAIVDRLVRSIYLETPDLDPDKCVIKLAKLEPNWSVTHNVAAMLWIKRGNYVAAERSARKASELAPNSITLVTNHANLLMRLRMDVEAIKGFERCLELRSKHYAALCNLGVLLGRVGRVEDARRRLATAIEVRPRLQRAQKILDALENGELKNGSDAPPASEDM